MANGKKGLFMGIVVFCVILISVVVFLLFKMNTLAASANNTEMKVKELTCVLGEYTVNLDDPSYKKYIKVKIYAGSIDKTLEAKVTENGAKINDMINTILRSKKLEDVNSADKTDLLKKEIKDRLNSALSDLVIDNIYFDQIIIQ